MKIHTLLSPHNVEELYFTGKTTVVIDVLRASTTIITALGNGAKEVIPVDSLDFAVKVSGAAFGGQTLLAGERNAVKVEGFALGNSPSEFIREVIGGKSIILYTTNGTKALTKAKFSMNLLVASFANISVLAKLLVIMDNNIEILCSGSNGQFCLEDTVCAGKLIREMKKLKEDVELSDASEASVSLYKTFGKNIHKMLENCEHGKILIEKGFGKDLSDAAKLNNSEIIPVYFDSVIKNADKGIIPEIEQLGLKEK